MGLSDGACFHAHKTPAKNPHLGYQGLPGIKGIQAVDQVPLLLSIRLLLGSHPEEQAHRKR